ncbi:putative invertase inhibitor [Tanacetum coccineum]
MSSSSTCLFLAFALLVTITAGARLHPVVHPNQNQSGGPKVVSPEIVAKACEPSPDKAFCVSVLKSQTVSDVKDLKQAAFVALQAASREAVATSEFIKVARQKQEDKEVVEDEIEEETLADCSQSYINIVEMLADATSALLTGPEKDVTVEINAALTTAETCDGSISGGRKSRQVEEAAKMNKNMQKFCENAFSIYNVYAKGH